MVFHTDFFTRPSKFWKVKKFAQLSSGEKKLFLEAYVTLGFKRAAILTVPFKRLTRSLEQQNDRKIMALGDRQTQTAVSVGIAINRASAYTPWQSSCLAQSLTAQRMLKKRGIPGFLYLGATKDDGGKEKMKAHAWSQCGEKIITGDEGHKDFAVLLVFGWAEK